MAEPTHGDDIIDTAFTVSLHPYNGAEAKRFAEDGKILVVFEKNSFTTKSTGAA